MLVVEPHAVYLPIVEVSVYICECVINGVVVAPTVDRHVVGVL